MDAKQDVKLYVYDVSKGLARSLSPMFLGRQIDGVWHTGIVVYGEEFYYGGVGIQSCSPGGTILGQPTEIVSLGLSELPYDIFLSYLEELSVSSFRGDKYHLFNHNCNSFSNEVANFLTGHDIPPHITNLPQEVLQTSFGAMIRPFVDAMSVSPEGGHALFDSSGNAALPHTESMSEAVTVRSDAAVKVPSLVTYSNTSMLEEFSTRRTSLVDILCPVDLQLVDEVYEYLTVKDVSDWSLGRAHIKTLCRLIGDVNITANDRLLLVSFLQMALLSDDVISACTHDPDASFANLVRDHETFSDDLLIGLAKCVSNSVLSRRGTEWLVSLYPHSSSSSSSLLIPVLCNSWLLSSDRSVRCVAAHVVSNVVRNVESLSAEISLDLAIPLIETCKQPDSESVEHLWYALRACVMANSQLAELLVAMGLDIDEQETNYPAISDYTREIRRVGLIAADS